MCLFLVFVKVNYNTFASASILSGLLCGRGIETTSWCSVTCFSCNQIFHRVEKSTSSLAPACASGTKRMNIVQLLVLIYSTTEREWEATQALAAQRASATKVQRLPLPGWSDVALALANLILRTR